MIGEWTRLTASHPPPPGEGRERERRGRRERERGGEEGERERGREGREGREGESEIESPPEGANFGVPFAFWSSEGAGWMMHLFPLVGSVGQLPDSRALLLEILRAPSLQDTRHDRPPPTSAE